MNKRKGQLFEKKKKLVSKEKDRRKKVVNKISSKLVFSRNIKGKMESTVKDIDQVLNLTEIRLDNMNIKVIENLDLYSKLTHLYLQRNIIEKISDEFDFLPNLQVLNLSNNKITRVEGLKNLENLKFLDLASNLISELGVEEFPPNLHIINIENNPICEGNKKKILRKHLIIHLGKILKINKKIVSSEERKEYDVKIDPNLENKQDEIIRYYQFDTTINTSSKFDEIVKRMKQSHSEGPDGKKMDTPKVSYYEQLFNESKRLREQRMGMMEKEFENMKLDFQKRTEEIVNRSKIRREKYKKEWNNKMSKKKNQNVQTISTSRQQSSEDFK